MSAEKVCRVCGKKPEKTAMVFKNEDWCSDNHRKVVLGETPPSPAEWAIMDQALFKELGGVCRE